MSAKSGLNRNALSDWIEGSYELPRGTNILNIEKKIIIIMPRQSPEIA